MRTRRAVAYLKIFLILLVAAWFALFAASAGVLVKSEVLTEDQLVPKLGCTYFTGFGFTRKEHILSDFGPISKAVCPRFIEFD
ncbi:MAG: hypothetical protein IH995_07475 [Proteobacteria bacterium]|nr:hypothetical protein [Pseudomonadota bacterium]